MCPPIAYFLSDVVDDEFTAERNVQTNGNGWYQAARLESGTVVSLYVAVADFATRTAVSESRRMSEYRSHYSTDIESIVQ